MTVSGIPSHARRGALLVALRTWLLPVALAGAAVGLHYYLHVPPGHLPPPSPAELEEKKKAAEKKKKDDEKAQKEADRKAGKAAPIDPNAPRELVYEPFKRPRDRYLLEQLWEYYEPRSFIKSEPIFEAFQTAHKPLISQIVNATRHAIAPDGPSVSVLSSECHTIRCRFTLAAATDEPLLQMRDALATLTLGDGSLWHSFVPGKLAEEPSKRDDAPARQKLEFTVSFTRDLPPFAGIELPGKGPLRAPPPPTRPTAVPGASAHSTTGTAPRPGTAAARPPAPHPTPSTVPPAR